MTAIAATYISDVWQFGNMAFDGLWYNTTLFCQFFCCYLGILAYIKFDPIIKIFFFSIIRSADLGISSIILGIIFLP